MNHLCISEQLLPLLQIICIRRKPGPAFASSTSAKFCGCFPPRNEIDAAKLLGKRRSIRRNDSILRVYARWTAAFAELARGEPDRRCQRAGRGGGCLRHSLNALVNKRARGLPTATRGDQKLRQGHRCGNIHDDKHRALTNIFPVGSLDMPWSCTARDDTKIPSNF
jgi:hypothetical protein